MKQNFVRTLLIGADVREAQWIRRALAAACFHRARFCWQIKSAKTHRAALVHLHHKATDIIMAILPATGQAAARLLQSLRETAPGVPIIALAGDKDEQLLTTVSALGAFDAVDKRKSDQPHPLAALVATGRSWTKCAEIEKLTPREFEIFTLIAEGKSTKEVAGHLDIAVKTAETHRTNLMRKLRVHSVSQLIRFAIRHRVVEV